MHDLRHHGLVHYALKRGGSIHPITIPKEYNGAVQLIWGADEIATCQTGDLPEMPCTNYAKLNDDGHDDLPVNRRYISLNISAAISTLE